MHMIIALGAGGVLYLLFMQIFRRLWQEEETMSRRLENIERNHSSVYQTQRQEILDQPFFDRTIRPLLEAAGGKMKKLPGYFGGSNEGDLKLQQQLIQAGSTMKVTEYTAIRMGITAMTMILAILLVLFTKTTIINKLLYLALGILGPYIVMRYALAGKVTRRKAAIEQQLPEVLDLMSVSVEAGLGFEQAIEYIVSNMEGELIDELAITSREIAMGRSRRSAFLLLGDRCGADTVKSFVGALVQAMDMGISMKVLLSSQAESMRLHRKRVVEEKAMKLSTKLLFPLIFFIFPSIFIVLLGPALMNIMQAL
ncbi:MAG: type II secretion system F family protein [Lachnospiraceae bacterium]